MNLIHTFNQKIELADFLQKVNQNYLSDYSLLLEKLRIFYCFLQFKISLFYQMIKTTWFEKEKFGQGSKKKS